MTGGGDSRRPHAPDPATGDPAENAVRDRGPSRVAGPGTVGVDRAVRLVGIEVAYGAQTALDRVDLTVERGERVALVGSSGAGKTTLLNVVSGLVRPDRGGLEVLGVEPGPLRGRRLRDHRSRIGTVSQHLDLALPLRVVHNVNAGRLGTWSTSTALVSLISPRGRHDVARALTEVGLGDRLWSRTDELSGGERQRVAVARVLRQRPELVVADEPTSSVDPHRADAVMALLCGTDDEPVPWTTVVSVHDPDLARRHATRIVGLAGGRVVLDRSASEVDDGDLDSLYGRLR